MASIYQEIQIEASATDVWDAVRDVGAIHERLVKGFVVDCKMDGDARVVTFANGIVAREVIVTIDDQAQRVVWSAAGGRLTHHNASVQIYGDGLARCRLVWIADLLPDAMAPAIAGMIDLGLQAMKRTLESPAGTKSTQR